MSAAVAVVTGGNRGIGSEIARQLVKLGMQVVLTSRDVAKGEATCAKINAECGAGGGRQRIQPVLRFLEGLECGGRTNFMDCCRQFISKYPQRGLVIVISDFLDDGEFEKPLQHLSDFGHEIILLQIWADQDRTPPWDGELLLEDAETGQVVEMAFDRIAREQYTAAVDADAERGRHVAQRSGGRYLGLPTSVPVDQAIFGPLVNTGAVA